MMATAPPALRDDVLAGRFFGARHAAGAEAVASFVAEPRLRHWFGDRTFSDIDAIREAVDRDIAAIDGLISAQLSACMAHPRFGRLEGSWRGLHWLAARVPYAARIKLRIMAARWAELCRDFQRAAEFDQSHLFKSIYEEEFGRPGGEPFGLLLADYEMRHAPAPGHPTDDVGGLDSLAALAAAAFAPLAITASPQLFGLDEYADAGAALDLTEVLAGADRQRWRNLQAREDARFVSVLLPRMLARPPWVDECARTDGFRPPHRLGVRVWTSPVYAMGAVVMRAFARYGWPADLRGAAVAPEAQGGVVDALPYESLSGDAPGAPPRPPIEVALTDLQERQLVEAGMLPLLGLEGLPELTFAAAPGLHKPPRMNGEAAEANQRLSTQFNAILCVSRFAHCIKVMGRDMVGAFRTPEEVERQLQRWLTGFTNSSGSAIGETAARYPLRNARVEVREQPGRPGTYGCVLHLQPHYQLDEVGAAFRLVTDLQAPGAVAA